MKRATALIAVLIACITAVAGGSDKLSFGLQQILARQSDIVKKTTGPTDDKVCVFIKFSNDSAEQILGEYGCEKLAQLGDIYIINVPLSRIGALSACDDVRRIEAQFHGRQLLDVTPQWVDNEPIYSGASLPQAFDGQGVLLGIVDGGFDLTHPSFYTTDGNTYRIKGFVDDYAFADETIGELTPIGREYSTETDILAKKCSGDAYSAEYHGTHCLGIAGGSGFGSQYRGMAYGTDIFAISSRIASEEYYSSASEVARMKRIFDYADEHGQPCVITYSIGFNDLPEDSQLYSEALAELTGEGHIVVAAAGNSNTHATYLEKPVGTKTAGTVMSLRESKGWAYMKSDEPFTVKCYLLKSEDGKDVLGDSISIDSENIPADSVLLGEYHIKLDRQGAFYTLGNRSDRQYNGGSMLIFAVEGEYAHIQVFADLQNSFSNILADIDGRFGNAERSHNINLPGSLPNIITVGALNGRRSFVNITGNTIESFGATSDVGTIGYFSSVGPTQDNRIKPDVVAPGVNIISSASSFSNDAAYGSSLVEKTTFNDREYPWICISGTSMATPCVAGIVALWLQADPTLTPERVKETLAATCTKPEEDLAYPNNTYGNGLIDAYAGMLHILNIPSTIKGISMHQPTALRIRPSDGQVSLSFTTAPTKPFTVRIYSVAGQLLAQHTITPTTTTAYNIPLTEARQGICVVQVDSNERGVSGSELIRF